MEFAALCINSYIHWSILEVVDISYSNKWTSRGWVYNKTTMESCISMILYSLHTKSIVILSTTWLYWIHLRALFCIHNTPLDGILRPILKIVFIAFIQQKNINNSWKTWKIYEKTQPRQKAEFSSVFIRFTGT